MALQEAINRARLAVFAAQPSAFFAKPAVIEADASIVPTDGETRDGMDIAYNGVWGYSSLLVSLANTKEPLYFNQSGANRPSHEGVVDLYDRAIALVREAGFSEVLLRGDTDFALTANFDHWDDQDVEFAFGFDARAMLVAEATSIDDEMYHELVRRAEREVKTRPRHRPVNVKQAVVRRRGFKVLRTAGEDVCEFTYRPRACTRDYRVVGLRKDLSVERGENVPSTSTAGSSTSRTSGRRPRAPRRSSWRPTFRRVFIDIPCQIVTGGRRARWRVLSWNPWLAVFFRLLDAL